MASYFSVYEAKARFSEVIRQVREGGVVTVTYRGTPVAEIRSIKPRQRQAVEQRLAELESSGVLVRAKGTEQTLRPVAPRPGALARFIAERDE